MVQVAQVWAGVFTTQFPASSLAPSAKWAQVYETFGASLFASSAAFSGLNLALSTRLVNRPCQLIGVDSFAKACVGHSTQCKNQEHGCVRMINQRLPVTLAFA
eukprot:3671163-Amphidinium_carterae.1